MADHHTEDLLPCRLAADTEIRMTIHRYTGARAGPTVYVQAAQHG